MLLQLVQKSGAKSVGVIGLAKNAGKTVTLNSLIKQAAGSMLTLGLTSLGYDGERVDLLTRLAKPRIFAPAGTLIATAEGTLARAEASLELVRATDFITALGPVVLARVREAGIVEIAGPDTLSEIRSVNSAMQQLGASLVLVDGALDRVGSAAPTVTDAAIIATGASVSNTKRKVIIKTMHAAAVLTLSASPPPVAHAAKISFDEGKIVYFQSGQTRVSSHASLLGKQADVIDDLGEASHLLIPGALTDSFLHELMQAQLSRPLPTLVVPDGTHIFASPEVWQRFLGRGGRVTVLHPVRLLAITVNPTAPSGRSFPPHDFAREISKALQPIPVFDLFLDDRRPILAD